MESFHADAAGHTTTVAHAVRHHALNAPDAEALVFPGSALAVSYGRLHADALSTAYSLREGGLGQGDVVALALDHGYPTVLGFLGAIYVGAVPAVLPSWNGARPAAAYLAHAERMVRQVDARAVLAAPGACDALRALSAPDRRVLPLHPPAGANPAGESLLDAVRGDRPAYLQFSSGSTGPPRGAVIQHGALFSHLAALSDGFVFGEDGVSVGWLPLHHDMGLVTQLLLPLALGARSVLMAPQAWLRRPASLLRAVHQHRGTLSTMPNFGFAHCVRRVADSELEGIDLGSWRTVVCGGEPIRAETMRAFAERFAPYGLSPRALMAGYGMAENTVGINHGPHGGGIVAERVSRQALEREGVARPVEAGDEDGVEVVSCGVPFAGTESGVVDGSDAPLPERRVGEIRIRGAALFAGYHGQPAETRAVMRDGWFHTGDTGYVAGGELYVVDRRKDLIITAGRNVSPAEIEAAIVQGHGSEVRRAAAFGVRDERLGTELPVAVVEVHGRVGDGERAELVRRIRAHVRAALDVELADVRPVRTGWIDVTTSGKVARNANRLKYLEAGFQAGLSAGLEAGLSDASSPEELRAALVRIVGAVTGRSGVDPHAHLADLGVDSLALVQVILLVEDALGRPVPVERLAVEPTVERLAALLADGDGAPSAPPVRSAGPVYPLAGDAPASPRLRLLQRGPVLGGRSLLPYAAGTRLLRAAVSLPGPHRALYRPEVRLLDEWLDRVPVRADREQVIRQSLMVNSWTGWRARALAPDEVFGRCVTLAGAEVLDALAAEGRGAVLVLPHTMLRRLLLRLPPLRGRNVAVVGNVGAARLASQGLPEVARAVERGVALSRPAVRSAQLVQALRTLAAGGLAVIFGDDDEGSGGMELPFHGRMRAFRPGAAELAVRSGAALVPVFAAMDLDGRIRFDFLPPLASDGPDHATRVRGLTRAYAELLAERYTVDLGAMDWYILRKFSHGPPAP